MPLPPRTPSSPPALPGTSPAAAPRPRRSRPEFCALINLLAFPGLGSILAGRKEGYPQAVVMISGFVLAMSFMGMYLRDAYRLVSSNGAKLDFESASLTWMAWWGLSLCLTAWVWAAMTSVSLMGKGANHSL